mmetsp:Transcript_34887/g.82194  ORF Transcript_34887/g.82194 Transcript_34887/m.82194 type:complete len:227 (-) Transcript_34887:9674-10354(-)
MMSTTTRGVMEVTTGWFVLCHTTPGTLLSRTTLADPPRTASDAPGRCTARSRIWATLAIWPASLEPSEEPTRFSLPWRCKVACLPRTTRGLEWQRLASTGPVRSEILRATGLHLACTVRISGRQTRRATLTSLPLWEPGVVLLQRQRVSPVDSGMGSTSARTGSPVWRRRVSAPRTVPTSLLTPPMATLLSVSSTPLLMRQLSRFLGPPPSGLRPCRVRMIHCWEW